MLRRDLVKIGAGLSLLGASKMARAAPPAAPQPTAFDNNTVRLIAQKLSKSAYKAPQQTLPSAIDNLNFDQFRGIAYKEDRALWHGQNLAFDVEFFPRGFLYRPRINMNEVVDGQTTPIVYDPDMFTYPDPMLRVTDDLGFSGLRLRNAINTPNVMEECAVFSVRPISVPSPRGRITVSRRAALPMALATRRRGVCPLPRILARTSQARC